MNAGRWMPVALWAVVILTITSVPDIPAPPTAGSDKLGHFTLYFVFGVLCSRAVSATRGSGREGRGATAVIGTIAAIALFAAVDEWHQRFIPRRSAEFNDWIADVCGAALGVALVALVRLRRSVAA